MKAFVSTMVVLLLVSGATLLGYARWTRPIERADAALADGRFEEAITGYQIAEARFDALPAMKQLLPIEHTRAVGNHLLALYRLKRHDEVIDLAQKAPAAATPNFFLAARSSRRPSSRKRPRRVSGG